MKEGSKKLLENKSVKKPQNSKKRQPAKKSGEMLENLSNDRGGPPESLTNVMNSVIEVHNLDPAFEKKDATHLISLTVNGVPAKITYKDQMTKSLTDSAAADIVQDFSDFPLESDAEKGSTDAFLKSSIDAMTNRFESDNLKFKQLWAGKPAKDGKYKEDFAAEKSIQAGELQGSARVMQKAGQTISFSINAQPIKPDGSFESADEKMQEKSDSQRRRTVVIASTLKDSVQTPGT